MKINPIGSTTAFGRRLNENEEKGYSEAVGKSLDILDKDLGIILHHSSAPAVSDKDTGIGSLYSEASRNLVLPFLNKHNFSSLQVEPETTRKFGDPSPYASSNNMANFLMSDLYLLTTDRYGNLLSKKTFDEIVKNNPNKGKNKTNFDYVNSNHSRALHEAWANFKKGESPQIQSLRDELELFKADKQKELESSILYEVLCEENGSDYFKNWGNELDRNLYEVDEDTRNARIAELKDKYADKIDYLYFTQMLISKMRDESIKEYSKYGISTIGDAPVAFSDSDVWSHPDLFLKGYSMGCPPDPGSPNGQAWGFAVYDPSKLFDAGGNLSEGGKFLFDKYQKLFEENKGGVRIDHILGLIDPFVYKTSPTENGSGRLFSTHQGELGRFYKGSPEDLQEIMEKIVIPAANSVGLSKDNILCEDLGIMPDKARIAFNNLGLRGMSITQYLSNKDVPAQNIIMPGSHDSPTIIEYTDRLYAQGDPYNYAAWPLTEDVLPEDASHDEKQMYFDDMRFDYNRPNAKEKFRTSKYAQLFTSPAKSVQIFWTDVLGEKDLYNIPGTSGGQNWTLRMGEDFEDRYYKNLEEGKGLNLPEALGIAIRQKGDSFACEHQDLLDELNRYTEILKEKE